jgi:hypothetical protein
LNVNDYADPTSFGRLHLLARPIVKDKDKGAETQSIDIEKTWSNAKGSRRVFLTQTPGSAHLLITTNDGGPNDAVVEDVEEKSFAQLRKTHHDSVEKWLRPVLRELHQESALAADPAVAWQVLAPQWPADSKYVAAVSPKIKALDDDNFRVRRQTADAIAKLGRGAALVLLKMNRSGLSLEQNLRIDEVIARFKPLSDADAQALGNDPNFLLDCLYGDDATARKLALDRLQAIAHKPIAFEVNASEEVRVNCVNAIRQQFFPAEPVKQ